MHPWSLSSNHALNLKLWLLTRLPTGINRYLGEFGEPGYGKYKNIGTDARSTWKNLF